MGSRAKLLRDLRHCLGDLSQEQLARRVGVSWSTISRWENDKGSPSPLAREKLVSLIREATLDARIDELDS
jgi:DNA-binding transcriptional regulator YiaG